MFLPGGKDLTLAIASKKEVFFNGDKGAMAADAELALGFEIWSGLTMYCFLHSIQPFRRALNGI